MESLGAKGQLPSWQGQCCSLGPIAFVGLHVCRPEEYGNDDATTDSWYWLLTFIPICQSTIIIYYLDAQMLFLSLSSGGFGWIPNLTDVDHSLILPVFMALSNLAIIEVI